MAESLSLVAGWKSLCSAGVRAAGGAHRTQVGDLLLEVLDRGEGAVHAREAQIGNLVELAQRAEDREPDLVARHLGAAARPHGLLDPLGQLLQCVLVDRPALARPAHAAHDLLAAERLGDTGTLDDGQHGLLDGGEAAAALRARPAAPDDLALVDLAGVDDTRVAVPTERTPHRPRTPLRACQPHLVVHHRWGST